MRIGLAGCGFVTRSFHLPALQRIEGAEVAAVADLDERALAEVADGWGVARRYGDARELAEDPELDVVAVCLPAAAHVEVASRALEAGKHVLVEKPLALSMEDADRLVELSRRSPGKAAVGFNLRSHRLVRRARAELKAQRLGPIQGVRSIVSDSVLERPGLPAWRKQRDSGGGALLDKLSHQFDLWRHLLDDEVREVSAVSRSNRSDDSVVSVTGTMRGGVVATALGLDETATDNEIVIYGEAGSITLSLYRSDGFVHAGRDDIPGAPTRRLAAGARGFLELAAGAIPSRRGGDFMTSYVTEWRGFLRAIETGATPECTLEDGRRALEIALAAAKAATDGRPVELAAGPS
jgi:predicted dehydrogenase